MEWIVLQRSVHVDLAPEYAELEDLCGKRCVVSLPWAKDAVFLSPRAPRRAERIVSVNDVSSIFLRLARNTVILLQVMAPADGCFVALREQSEVEPGR